jgi:hypothetical protein
LVLFSDRLAVGVWVKICPFRRVTTRVWRLGVCDSIETRDREVFTVLVPLMEIIRFEGIGLAATGPDDRLNDIITR